MLTKLKRFNDWEVYNDVYNITLKRVHGNLLWIVRNSYVNAPIRKVLEEGIVRRIKQRLQGCIKKIVVIKWEDDGSR